MFKPAVKDEREHFPALVEDIGEDPARFLDNSEDGSKRELILARIRGIDRIQVLNAWLAVERRLNGGRRVVVDAIEERRAYLEEHGERELQGLGRDELQALALEAVDDDQEEDVEPTWRHERCGGIDVERESSRTWFCNECEQRTNRVEAVAEEEPELVADGGINVNEIHRSADGLDRRERPSIRRRTVGVGVELHAAARPLRCSVTTQCSATELPYLAVAQGAPVLVIASFLREITTLDRVWYREELIAGIQPLHLDRSRDDLRTDGGRELPWTTAPDHVDEVLDELGIPDNSKTANLARDYAQRHGVDEPIGRSPRGVAGGAVYLACLVGTPEYRKFTQPEVADATGVQVRTISLAYRDIGEAEDVPLVSRYEPLEDADDDPRPGVIERLLALVGLGGGSGG